MRDMHLTLEDEHNKKVKDIAEFLIKQPGRSGDPNDSEAIRYSIVRTHEMLCKKKTR